MKKTFSILATPMVLALGTLVGCASSTAVADDAQDDSDLKSGETFKLYTSKTAVPDSFCDKHTVMKVAKSSQTPGALVVTTEYKIAGNCELFADPNKRQFIVKPGPRDACGSLSYSGKGGQLQPGGTALSDTQIQIMDHRSRRCADGSARLDVTIGSGAGATKLYAPQPPTAAPRCRVGNKSYAVGETFPDRCNTCTCQADGGIMCTEAFCG